MEEYQEHKSQSDDPLSPVSKPANKRKRVAASAQPESDDLSDEVCAKEVAQVGKRERKTPSRFEAAPHKRPNVAKKRTPAIIAGAAGEAGVVAVNGVPSKKVKIRSAPKSKVAKPTIEPVNQIEPRKGPIGKIPTSFMSAAGTIVPGGAGHERGGQAVQRDKKKSQLVDVGNWLAQTRDGQCYDLRHLQDQVGGQMKSMCVPGWRGVRIDWSEGNHWSEGYKGKYMAMKKDRGGAHWRMAALCDTVEEAAVLHDKIEIVWEGVDDADTNYPVTNYAVTGGSVLACVHVTCYIAHLLTF